MLFFYTFSFFSPNGEKSKNKKVNLRYIEFLNYNFVQRVFDKKNTKRIAEHVVDSGNIPADRT